jgi:type I restriction enzyme S subunit
MKNDWEVKKLGEISAINYGYTEKASLTKVGPKFLRITDIQNDGVKWENVPFCKIQKNDLSKYLLCEGDIVFARTGATTGKSFLVKAPPLSVFASYLIRLKITSPNLLSPEFLIRFFQTKIYWDAIECGVSGSAQGGFNASKLADLSIPIPPLPEQKRIVAILDEAFAAITTAKENAEKNLKNARELFESYLQSVFTNPGDGWEEKKLGEVCSLITDGKHGDCENEANSGYYFLSAKDVYNNTLHYENARQITKIDFEETHRRTNLNPGDVLITNSGTIGRMAIAPDDEKTFKTTFQKSVAILKPKAAIINNIFCCYQLRADLSKLTNVSQGAAQKNLLLRDLRSHTVMIPPFPDQKPIVSILDALSEKTKKLESIYQQKLASLEELKKSILQKAFSGELKGATL